MPTAISGRKGAICSCPIACEPAHQRDAMSAMLAATTAELDDPRQAPRLPPDRLAARRCAALIDRAVVSRVSICTARNADRRREQARGVGMTDRERR